MFTDNRVVIKQLELHEEINKMKHCVLICSDVTWC